jgi:hypothetical protein
MPTDNRRADRHFRGMANDNPTTSKRQPRPTTRRTNTRSAAIAAHLKEF